MAKAFYQYTTEGVTFGFLCDTDTAAAIGLAGAGVGTPRLPHKLKPAKLGLRSGPPGSYKYRHQICDEALQATKTMGQVITIAGVDWIIVGFDGEVNNAFSAY